MAAPLAVPVYDYRAAVTTTTALTVRAGLDAFLVAHGVSGDVRLRVRHCVTETVANVLRHAYPSGRGSVEVVADIERDLQLVVMDEGAGIRRADDDVAGYGLGLVVVAEYADDLTLCERLPRGVEAWMRFVL